MSTDSGFPCVMIVDDEVDALTITHRLVEKAAPGAHVIPISAAREAMAHLLRATHPGDRSTMLPDVILLDLHMPGTEGFELLRWIRRNQSLAPVKVVMLSSSESHADVERATRMGAHGFLIKYPNSSCLASVLKQAIHGAVATPRTATNGASDPVADSSVPAAE